MKERPSLPASAPDLGRTVKQTSTHPIGDRGPLPGRPEGPSILGQAAIYWTLPRIMFTSSILPMPLFRKTGWLACRTVAALKFDDLTC